MYYTEKQKRGVAECRERPPIFELLFKFNSRRTQRVNPFATLVRALAALGDAFMPPVLFDAETVPEGAKKKIVSLPAENPITSYRQLLCELRDLYSRTGTDSKAQRSKMSAGNTELHPGGV
ncbi:hypothetical protein C2E23DRAFT_863963 [Lenzites betulinus]|nr:hypothetical protein C2E23DRAFT_863963 [Lenzites betulinus]